MAIPSNSSDPPLWTTDGQWPSVDDYYGAVETPLSVCYGLCVGPALKLVRFRYMG